VRNLRLLALIPHPRELLIHQPFNPVGDGLFGIQTVPNATLREEAELLASCRKAMSAGATVGLVPAEMKIGAVFFDMDATVIAEESIVELAKVAGKESEVAAVTEQAMAGDIDFAESLTRRVGLLRGVPASILPEIAEGLTLNPGIQSFVGFCRQINVPVYMVSGGFHQLAEVVNRKVGFSGFLANRLGVAGDALSGSVDGSIIDAAAKKQYLLSTCERIGIPPGSSAAVGDGANDLLMLQSAGVAVGFQPKPVLISHLHAANFKGDHRMLAPLLFGRDLTIRRSAVPI